MRYLITISYDGSNYYGFQRLNDLPSIQSEIEKALSIVNKEKVIIKASGRTDKGVHALGQVFHVDLKYDIPVKRLKNAINNILPCDIRVIKCIKCNREMHARFNVKEKTYKYIINMGDYDLFNNNYLYNYCNMLDIKKMKLASKCLIGKHSYKSFVCGYRDNYNSEIFNVVFKKEKNLLIIKFIGKSFYRYMVRNMVGALIKVGSNKMSVDEFKKLVDSEKEYSYFTVPSNGLYLEKVKY